MTDEENKLLTRVGPGTGAGQLLRRFWQPAALSEELPQAGPPRPVRLFGEDLVLFRDEKGRPGLLDMYCSHRRADLSYGRIEDGGLRCLYHGWLYDVNGKCLEQPGEPERGARNSIKHTAYPCRELGDIIFTYMGPGAPPELPCYEALLAPKEHRFIKKYFMECNYLQGAEGDVDPAHPSLLHSRRSVSVSGDQKILSLYTQDRAPRIDIEPVEFGMRIYTTRKLSPEEVYLRTSYYLLPNLFVFPEVTGLNGYTMNCQVPVDDFHHWKYQINFSRDKALDLEKWRSSFEADITPDYRLLRNKRNRYLQNRDELKSETFTGMGTCFAVHDAFATETPGPLQDRTKEHLVSSDLAIITFRKLLLKAIKDLQAGVEPARVPVETGSGHLSFLKVVSKVVPNSVNVKECLG
jgi:phenylpropionate dioxygenase-like ring-hydroxylating dioxygenase large terminal subunit